MGEVATPIEPLSVTIGEAQRLSGVGRTTIYKLIDAKKLRAIKIGSRTLIEFQSLKRLAGGGKATA